MSPAPPIHPVEGHVATHLDVAPNRIEQEHWLGRKRASLAMARNAASSRARLIHYELAGAYSLKAARSAKGLSHTLVRLERQRGLIDG